MWLNKDFEDAKKEDIERVVGTIERGDYSPFTRHDYKAILKYFYKWLRGGDEYPVEVKWLKVTTKGARHKLPEDMLTADEIRSLVQAATHPRDRAFIATLQESGCRVGELGGLRIKNVKFDNYGATLIVDGKTGMRRVRVVAAAPFLTAWINVHPHASDREAFLWVNKQTGEFIGYRGIWKMMKIVSKRAGVTKKTNCHNFRHTRASFLANFLTPAQMNEFFGWTQSSNMPAVYVHLSGRNVDSALLGIYGMKPEEANDAQLIKPKICPHCNAWNQFTNIACEKCSRLLDESTETQTTQERKPDTPI